MKYKISVHPLALDNKIPPGHPLWATFNDQFVNKKLDVMELANEIWTGHSYTSWHEGRRSLGNFTEAQHIAVDMDTNDERSSIKALSEHPLWRMYGSLIHTTPSHTPESPRARIVFLLDRTISDADGYSEAAKFLTSQFDGADTACTDASRFFYGAKNATIEVAENLLPLSDLRIMYTRWKRTLPPERVRTPYIPPADISPEEEVRKLQEALGKIDPWRIEFTQWIAVLAAIHDTLGDRALPLAEQWAQGTPGEVQRRWRTFGNYSGTGASLGTVFHLASM